MQLIKSLVIVAALGILTESVMASVDPYFGGGYEWSTANHRRGDSHGSMFNKYFGGANAYLGARCHDISIEAGYECTGEESKSGSHTATPHDQEVVTASIRTRNYFKGWHLDLKTYFPIKDDFELITSFGYGVIKHKASGNITLMVSEELRAYDNLHFSNRYGHVARIGIGAQQMLCDHIGIRAMIRYKLLNNRTRLKSELFGINESVKYKNLVSLKLGFIFKF